MADATVLGVDLAEIQRLEEEADRVFGPESRAVRTALGCLIAYLNEAGGPEAARNYVQKCLGVIRRIDPLDTPPAAPSKAS